MKFDLNNSSKLKKLLKKIKLNEENISMILGAIVLVIVGILVVNYFKDRTPGNVLEEGGQTATLNEHVVVKGETLWSIAESSYGSGYNWVDIKKANNLTSDSIEVGQKLVIPENITVSQPTTTEKAETTNLKSATIQGETYTVVKGDNLWNIAVRAYGDGYKWTEIAKANKLTNPDIIHAGNVLTLPR